MISKIREIRAKKRQKEQLLAVKEAINHYLSNGRIPWSKGYQLYKTRYISEAINNKGLLLEIAKSGKLPLDYGEGLDERCVEYAWVMANLSSQKGVLLDAGSTFNFDFMVNHETIKKKELSVYTFYPEENDFLKDRISYHFGDLRMLPYRENWFDEVACISTIEHVDMDNSIYGYDLAQNQVGVKSYDYLKVIAELERVLKSKGQLLLTFPFGKYEYHDFFQQFDSDMVKKIDQYLSVRGGVEKSFYQYIGNHWAKSNEVDCANEISHNPHTGKGKGTDGAAHSRAICCIKFVKD